MNGGFDIHRDSPWIGGAAFVLFFGASLIFAMLGGGKWNLRRFQFYLAHIVFVPIAVFLTLWCYQHPEQLDNNPDGWMSDLRPLWPLIVIGDICAIAMFVSREKQAAKEAYKAQALRYFGIGDELWMKGEYEEAGYAYAKARWIVDNKGKADEFRYVPDRPD